jgi:hypothetical protein
MVSSTDRFVSLESGVVMVRKSRGRGQAPTELRVTGPEMTSLTSLLASANVIGLRARGGLQSQAEFL